MRRAGLIEDLSWFNGGKYAESEKLCRAKSNDETSKDRRGFRREDAETGLAGLRRRGIATPALRFLPRAFGRNLIDLLARSEETHGN
jgi:hypothetical protein